MAVFKSILYIRRKIISSLQKINKLSTSIFRSFKDNKIYVFLLGVLVLAAIGILDFLQGYRYSFSIFYLVPITMVTWANSRLQGILFSISAAFIWLIADYIARPGESDFIVIFWNSILRMGFFLIVTILLAALKKSFTMEETLARKDYLTGIWNRLAFYEMAEAEIARSERYKSILSIAYLDLDNFKSVNDQFGHEAGDRLLKIVSDTVNEQIRKTDVFARMGGDEFALLLPETVGVTGQVLLDRIRQHLLTNMKQNGWPVTFSIGLICFLVPPGSVSIMIRTADELMYTVKKSIKNSIVYREFPNGDIDK